MSRQITDEVLIAEGIEPFVTSVFGMVDRLFPSDGNAEVRSAILELFMCAALERMTYERRMWLVRGIVDRWKKGLN